jgi:hypothetical protein
MCEILLCSLSLSPSHNNSLDCDHQKHQMGHKYAISAKSKVINNAVYNLEAGVRTLLRCRGTLQM